MNLQYDPADDDLFWHSISKIPGYPIGENKPIKTMLFESGALFKTTSVLKIIGASINNPLIIVVDGTVMHRGDDDLKDLISEMLRNDGWQINKVVLIPDENGQVHTDMKQIEMVKSHLNSNCNVLSVGSGVVTDITKHACYLFRQETGKELPYVVFQTANSVSAYTSCLAPVFINGVKRTVQSRYPDGLICDIETLVGAPIAMTVAGVGDMLAAFVSLPDWYLAHEFGMDTEYSEFAVKLLGPVDNILLFCIDDINKRTHTGMSILAKLIALGGLAMSLSHTTTPMSGFEHVMSHVLDLQFEMKNSRLPQHGSQVALATIVGLEMFIDFINRFDPNSVCPDTWFPDPEVMKIMLFKNFNKIDASGKAGLICWSDYLQKLQKWTMVGNSYSEISIIWPQIKRKLAEELVPVRKTVQILNSINAPVQWSQLNPQVSEKSAKFAFMNASLMRKRFTIGDLLIFTSWDRDSLWKNIWNDHFRNVTEK